MLIWRTGLRRLWLWRREAVSGALKMEIGNKAKSTNSTLVVVRASIDAIHAQK